MYLKYIGDGPGAVVYLFPQYEFPQNEWVKVDNIDGDFILKDYSGFIKKELKKR